MTIVEVAGTSYFIHPGLKVKWDKIRDGKLAKRDEDRVYIVDGRERIGKSLFAMQQACYIDPSMANDLTRICFTADEFLSAIKKADPGQCVIFDEAFRGLSSRAALSKINKKIIQALMEVGQKNLVIFIVLPSFFMLDSYPAMLRSHALFHIAKDRGNRRYFKLYNFKKKGLLYRLGVKSGWSYKVPSKFKGNFYGKYPGGDEFEKVYRAKKAKSLDDMGMENMPSLNKYDKQAILNEKHKVILAKTLIAAYSSYRKAGEAAERMGLGVAPSTLLAWSKGKIEENALPVA
jgi:hypothetical protein